MCVRVSVYTDLRVIMLSVWEAEGLQGSLISEVGGKN